MEAREDWFVIEDKWLCGSAWGCPGDGGDEEVVVRMVVEGCRSAHPASRRRDRIRVRFTNVVTLSHDGAEVEREVSEFDALRGDLSVLKVAIEQCEEIVAMYMGGECDKLIAAHAAGRRTGS